MNLLKRITNLSLKHKLIVMFVFVAVASVAVCVASLSFVNIKYAEKELQNDLQVISDITAEHLVGALAFNDFNHAKSVLSTLKRNSAIQSACMYDASGVLFIAQAIHSETRCNRMYEDEVGTLKLESKIAHKGEDIGELILFASTEKISSFIYYHVLIVLIGIAVVIFFISVPLAGFLQRQISVPVTQLLEVSKNISLYPEQIEQRRIADELLYSLVILKKVEYELSANKFNSVKVDAVLNNKSILLNILEEKTGKIRKMRDALNMSLEGNPYQDLSELYNYNIELFSIQDEEIQELIDVFKELNEDEDLIIKNGSRSNIHSDLVFDVLSESFSKHFSPNVNLVVSSPDDPWALKVYYVALKKCLDAILILLEALSYDDKEYELLIDMDTACLTFILKPLFDDEQGNYFDLNHVSIDEFMLRAKHYSNINNPFSTGLSIECSNKNLRLTLRPAIV